MTRKKPISKHPAEDALSREGRRLLEPLVEYLADLAAKGHFKRVSKGHQPSDIDCEE